jgi:hypothetical protein
MNLVSEYSVCESGSACIVERMAEPAGKLERQFVKLSAEHRRRLIHLSVEADARSLEVYAGELLSGVIDRLWADFDPKRADAKPKKLR